MEKRNLTVAGPGAVRPTGAPAAGGTRPRPAAGAPHGPFDLEAAAARLERLLAEDAEAGGFARADVPRRGFYINVAI